jgi:hypothetical protein
MIKVIKFIWKKILSPFFIKEGKLKPLRFFIFCFVTVDFLFLLDKYFNPIRLSDNIVSSLTYAIIGLIMSDTAHTIFKNKTKLKSDTEE